MDTGAQGAIATIQGHSDAPLLATWDLHPLAHPSGRGLDCTRLLALIRSVTPSGTHTWIEANTARPGEVPDYAQRHGLNAGQLEMGFTAAGAIVHRLAPSEWTARIGIRGKADGDPACQERARKLVSLLPQAGCLICGPRGGVISGRCDALLIAWYGWLALTRGEFVANGANGGGGEPVNMTTWARRQPKGLEASDDMPADWAPDPRRAPGRLF